MVERAVPMDVRLVIATWPDDSPRGAVSRFCEANGVSRSQFYELRRRAQTEELPAVLAGRSRRPLRSPSAVSLDIEDLAVRLRKQLADDGWDCGPRSVRHQMQLLGVSPPSPATLARIFTRRGVVTPQPQKRPRSSWRRFTFPAPNSCWQLDATEWALLDGTVVAIFQVLDDHSRRVLASLAASGETSDGALTVVRLALQRFGSPQLFLSDNGAALNPTRRGRTGQLETYLRSIGVKPITASPNHPQTCGKNERVHQTLKRYLRARPRAASLTELQKQLDSFDEHYNHHRPHQALAGKTPVAAWQATPLAPAPAAPEPTTPPPARPAIKVTRPRADSQGKVWVGNRSIHLGSEYAGRHVLALRDGDTIDLFTLEGTHIRSLTLEPGRTYYGSGRPRGQRPRGPQ
jgi:transposase InsO family protein